MKTHTSLSGKIYGGGGGKSELTNSHNPSEYFIQCKKVFLRGFFLKDYIEERAINIANYIIENNATVRQTARQFGISKSTVHMVVTIWNDLAGTLFG